MRGILYVLGGIYAIGIVQCVHEIIVQHFDKRRWRKQKGE